MKLTWAANLAGGEVQGDVLVGKSVSVSGKSLSINKVMGSQINMTAIGSSTRKQGIKIGALYAEGPCSLKSGESRLY